MSCVTLASSSSVWPPWSCTTYWKPPKVPSPSTGGGTNGSTIASVIPKSGPRSRSITLWAECADPRRSEYGFSPKNIRPRLGAVPAKLNPVIAKTVSVSGCCWTIDCALSPTLFVYSSDAPSGGSQDPKAER